MEVEEFLGDTERNLELVDAMESALIAMRLTNGCSITLDGFRGILNFEREIGKLVQAILLLEEGGTEVPSFEAMRGRQH